MAHAEVVARKELFITDLSVVNDSRTETGGPWSFGSVLSKLAPDSADAMAADWLKTWEKESLNGLGLAPRPIQRLARRWGKDASGILRAKFAPFRLMAVVYRPDAGEGRLVYCAIDPVTRAEVQFNVILEFQLPGAPGAWARAFHELGSLPFGPEYNAKLASLVDSFVSGKNLIRLLTNEVELGLTWELREFQLNRADKLELVPLAQTPHDDFAWSGAGKLARWLKANTDGFTRGLIDLPESMSGGSASIFRDNFYWLKGEGLDENVRRTFALKTCTGCHGAESNTLFTHLAPRNRRAETRVSAFVTSQLPAREKALEALLQTPLSLDHVSPPPPLPLSKRRVHN